MTAAPLLGVVLPGVSALAAVEMYADHLGLPTEEGEPR